MYCTIKHSFPNGRVEIYHGLLWWIDKSRGTFMFQTQRDGHAVEFWCNTEFWNIHPLYAFGRITVEGELNERT